MNYADGWICAEENPPKEQKKYLCSVHTDDGDVVEVCEYVPKKNNWMHEFEYTFQKPYWFRVYAYKELPPTAKEVS